MATAAAVFWAFSMTLPGTVRASPRVQSVARFLVSATHHAPAPKRTPEPRLQNNQKRPVDPKRAPEPKRLKDFKRAPETKRQRDPKRPSDKKIPL